MKLAQFLALGNSIANVSQESRYKLNPHRGVPHFGGRRMPAGRIEREVLEPLVIPDNPVALTETPSLPSRLATPVAEKISELPGNLSNVPEISKADEAQVAPTANPTTESHPPRRKAGVGTWILGRRVRITDPVALAAKREQALKSVRPVRNDLSETDYVVVPQGAQLNAAGVCGKASFWQRCVKWIFD